MPSDKTQGALLDIRDNIVLATNFVAGLTVEQFTADRRTYYAVVRALEIISEAARRLPPELTARHPQQPWRAIMGAGNVYRHNYDNVAEQMVWQTVHNDLPALLTVVVQEIAGT